MNEKKILVLYVLNKYNDRSKKFINETIFDDKKIDFIIIFNGIIEKEGFEVPNYAKKLIRKNRGLDFGGWTDGLIKLNLYDKYRYFIFLNDSIEGPYCQPMKKWPWKFIENINRNNVKLHGCTINCRIDPPKNIHVQSYAFCADTPCVKFLIDSGIFSIKNYCGNKNEAVKKREIVMSKLVLQNGWNIGCFHKHYKNVDFTFKKKSYKSYNIEFYNDIMYPKYENKLWTTEELIFIKGNRK